MLPLVLRFSLPERQTIVLSWWGCGLRVDLEMFQNLGLTTKCAHLHRAVSSCEWQPLAEHARNEEQGGPVSNIHPFRGVRPANHRAGEVCTSIRCPQRDRGQSNCWRESPIPFCGSHAQKLIYP